MKNRIIIFVLGISLIYTGCKKEKEPYDECKDHVPISSNFSIEESYWKNNKMESDTVLTLSPIYFTCKQSFHYYDWTINGIPVTNVISEFNTSFNTPGTYVVKLIASRAPNTTCYPYDGGLDSTEKEFVVLNNPTVSFVNSSPLIGKYNGRCNSDTSHFFEIEIGNFPINSGSSDSLYGINNFPEGCPGHWFYEFSGAAFSAFTFGNGTPISNCNYFKDASGYLLENRSTIVINYRKKVNNNVFQDTYLGEKE